WRPARAAQARASAAKALGGTVVLAGARGRSASRGRGGPWAAAAAAATEYSCEYGATKYLLLCGLGGMLSCGLTHTAIVPLDLVKCRMRVDPGKYRATLSGFGVTMREDGLRGLARGRAPTFFGYSLQGLFKFGLYEAFKIQYGQLLGQEKAYVWRTGLYLAPSASAEFFADVAPAPMEAVKARVQTQPGYAGTLRTAAPRMYSEEGPWAFYRGVAPLWMRQIPYTMMKVACFERAVEARYKYAVPKPQGQRTKAEQLGVTFVAGYIPGVFCAVVSHPADSVVSVLNKEKGSTALGVLRKLGFTGVWKGLFARIIVVGTLTVYFKLPRPPVARAPESPKKQKQAWISE
uniref:Solute carrier family 25 member 3 n=1 Tax=Prolemur simus TaxID=1328070 RepID=A0A8C9A0E6_PROSS